MRPTFLTAALLVAAPAAFAQDLPPRDTLPLSQIVAGLEANPTIGVIEEIDWDDDGYWDVEVVGADDRSRSIRVDPVTGAEIPRP